MRWTYEERLRAEIEMSAGQSTEFLTARLPFVQDWLVRRSMRIVIKSRARQN